MFRKSHFAIGTILSSALILGGLYCSAPNIAKWYINKNYPYVKFDKISLSTSDVILHNVVIEKDNVSINSPFVKVNQNSILFLGGEASIKINHKDNSNSTPKKSISAYFDKVTINSNSHQVNLQNVFISPEKTILFQSIQSSINYNNESFIVNGNFGYIDKKNAFSSYSNITHKQSSKSFDIVNANAYLKLNELTADTISIGKYGKLNGIHFKYNEDKTISILINLANVQHETFFAEPVDIEHVNVQLDISNKNANVRVGQVELSLYLNEKRIVSSSSCQNWIDILPAQLRKDNPLEDKIKMNGNIAFDISIGNKPSFSLKYDCSLASSCSSLPHITNLQKPFTYYIYDENKTRTKRESGPGSKEWVSRSSISEHLVNAAVRMEDPGFPHHNGVLIEALKNSFDINVKSEKFIRGGSTITMQTAKNLWLSRDKTIGRKASELLLATTLNKCLSKDQVIELYFNIIEYNKNVYGIANGAQYYFQKSPNELDPIESFYIASILPRPRTAAKPDEAALLRIESLIYKLNFDSINVADAYIAE